MRVIYVSWSMYGLDLALIFALMTALLIILVIAPGCIRRLQRYKLGQVVRDDGPQSHLSKTGTPTMGGVLILFAVLVSCLLWGLAQSVFMDCLNRYAGVWLYWFSR